MNLNQKDLEELFSSPDYQQIPIQAANEVHGTTRNSWWQKAEDIAHYGAELSIWGVSSALEIFFDTYKDKELSVRLKWSVEGDRGDVYIDTTMRVNDNYYHPDCPDVDEDILSYMEEVDNYDALHFLHNCMEGAVFSSFSKECETVSNAFSNEIRNIDDARAARVHICQEVQTQIKGLVALKEAQKLAVSTPEAKLSKPGPRF